MAEKEKISESPSSSIEAYLLTASEQIRWKRARPALAAELETHLLDQVEAYRSAGMPTDEAEAEAVRQMGDPIAVGQALDAVHRPAPQWAVLGIVAAVAIAGAAVQLFCSVSLDMWWIAVPKVVAFTLAGLFLMVVLHLLDCQAFLARHALPIAAAALGIACLVAAMSDSSSYATRLAHSFHSLTLAFPLLLALLINRFRKFGWRGFASCAGAAVLMVPLAGFFGDAPQLFTMAASAVFLLAHAAALDWFGVSRSRGAVALAVLVAIVAPLFAFTGALEGCLGWVFVLEGSEQELLTGSGLVAWTSFGVLDASSPLEYQPLAPAMALGSIPIVLLCAGLLLASAWLAARETSHASRLHAMIGASVFLVILGELLTALVPFAFGLMLSGSVLPFLTPGFHNVVLMSLIGIVLSGFRCANAPHVGETRVVRGEIAL